MKKYRKAVIGAAAMLAVALLCGTVTAGNVISKVQDAAIAMRVYNGSDETLSITIATGGASAANYVVIGTCTNTIDGSGTTDTIAELGDAIIACTNSSGDAELTTDEACSLSGDSTDGELLDGTYTAASGEWLELLWDTSAALHYDVYLPGRTQRRGASPYTLKRVQGLPGGTGNVTLSVYENGTLIASKVITSPIYLASDVMNMTGTVTNVTVNDVTVDWELDMPFSAQYPVIVRAARATTATTGVLSAICQ